MRKSKFFVFALLSISITAYVSSCTHETINPSNGQCDPDSVYFENDILPLIVSNCATSGCHDAASAEDGVVLDNYENIMSTGEVKSGRPSRSELYEVLTKSGDDRMPPPPASALSSEQIKLIENWIDQGALNNSCIAEETGCDTASVTLSATVRPVLTQWCQGCHNNTSASGGVNVESYTGLKAIADNGSLLGSIKHETGYKAMPQGLSKLDDCSIAKIEIWIREGAQDN